MSVQLSDDEARDLIEALDAYEGEIETLQSSKRDLLTDARERLAPLGATKGDTKVCIAAVKKAVADLRRKRMKPEAAEQADERDALAEHYIELCSRVRAPRAAREDTSDLAPTGGSFAGALHVGLGSQPSPGTVRESPALHSTPSHDREAA